MTPNTTQTADTFTTIATEQYKKGELHPAYGYFDSLHKCQATEIAELKAKLAGAEAEIAALKQGLHRADEKLADLMPLAKFGAMFLSELEPDYSEVVTEFCLNTGVLDTASEYAPNIKATIEQILKD